MQSTKKIYEKPSPLFFLPVEIIDRIVYFLHAVTEKERNESWSQPSFPQDLLDLSRIERNGGNWMESAERRFFKEISIRDSDSTWLRNLANLEDNDRRLQYIQDVHADLDSREDRINLSQLLPRLSNLRFLSLEFKSCDWPLYRSILLNVVPLEVAVIRSFGPFEENEDDWEDVPISIADIPSLKTAVALHCTLCIEHPDPADLSYYFGTSIWPSLQNLSMELNNYSEIRAVLHLFPNLLYLHPCQCLDLDLLSSLPPSLTTLSSIASPNIADQLRSLKNKPFGLTHFYFDNYFKDFDYSVLPLIPSTVKILGLGTDDPLLLAEALKKIKLGQVSFQKLSVFGYNFAKGIEKESVEEKCSIVEIECKRLGIEFKRSLH